MSQLCNITHDAGNLTEWTSTSGADISAAAAAAANGTPYGMQIVIDDTTDDYGEYSVAIGAATDLHVRIYHDLNTVAITTNYHFYQIIKVMQSGSPYVVATVNITKVAGNYYVRQYVYNDAGAESEGAVQAITDNWHCIEIAVKKATTVSANDGTCRLYTDGTLWETISGLDLFTTFALINRVRAGALTASATVSGTVYSDEVIIRNDDQMIGAYVPPAILTKKFENTLLRM
jgi:hypothetical protein